MKNIFLVIQSLFGFGNTYYQDNGNSFWYDLFISFFGAFAGFGLSLIIYSHQIKKEKEKDELEKKLKDKNLLKYYSELIRKNLKVGQKNIELVNEYIIIQEVDLTNLKIVKRQASYDFQRLLALDNSGIFEAWNNIFTNQDKIKIYQSTNSAIDSLEAVIKNIYEMNKTTVSECYNELNEVKKYVDDLPDKLMLISYKIVKELGTERHKDKLFEVIELYLKIYRKLTLEGAPISKFMAEFVHPLLKTLNNEFAEHHDSPDIMMICKKARVKFNDAEMHMKNMINDFKTLSTKVLPLTEKLTETLTSLDAI